MTDPHHSPPLPRKLPAELDQALIGIGRPVLDWRETGTGYLVLLQLAHERASITEFFRDGRVLRPLRGRSAPEDEVRRDWEAAVAVLSRRAEAGAGITEEGSDNG